MANISQLDPTVQVLVIPSSYASRMTSDETLSADLDRALAQLQIQAGEQTLSSLTWSALRGVRPAFTPSYLEWAGEHASLLGGDAGLVFFLDIPAIVDGICDAAEHLGFSARGDRVGPTVHVTDGTYVAHVGVNALVAEALWTGCGPLYAVRRRAHLLPGEFRSFSMTTRALRQRFPHLDVDVGEDGWTLTDDGEEHTVDYRHLAAAMRGSGLSAHEWLGRIMLSDLISSSGTPSVLLRSPAYLRAWPEALAEDVDGHALVAVRRQGDRIRPVLSESEEPHDRFSHYRDEAARQIGYARFETYILQSYELLEDITVVVGDGAASIALDSRCVRGVIEAVADVPARARVVAPSENVLIVSHDDIDDDSIEEAVNWGSRLEADLFDDPSDRLQFDKTIALPELAAGHFDLIIVDPCWFDFHDEIMQLGDAEASRRAFLRGACQRSLERSLAAIACFEQAVRLAPNDGDHNLALGQALLSNGDGERARSFLERAYSLLSENAEAANSVGLSRYAVGETQAASEAFEKAVRLDPDDTTFLVNLARCYAEDRRYDRAHACLERALELEPRCGAAHASLALVYREIGDASAARHHANEALLIEPDDAAMRRLLLLLDDDPGLEA